MAVGCMGDHTDGQTDKQDWSHRSMYYLNVYVTYMDQCEESDSRVELSIVFLA